MTAMSRRRTSATLADIAKAAGVGRTTVVRALQNRPDVSADTRARIQQIATELKYRPNSLARSLITGKSHIVGVLATPNLNTELNQVVPPIERVLAAAGYRLLYCCTDARLETERHYIEQLIDLRVDGVLALPDQLNGGAAAYRELAAAGVYLVVLDQPIVELPVPQIASDHAQAMHIAVEHLVQLGHRRIVNLGEPPDTPLGAIRAGAFESALRAAGVPWELGLLRPTGDDLRSGFDAATLLLRETTPPTAFITRHTAAALGVMHAIEQRGWRVPEDCSVVSTGDDWFIDMLRTPLTRVRFRTEEVVWRGTQMLLALLAGEPIAPTTTLVPAELVRGSSSGPAPQRAE
jgi:LacI family transcriptional regulator